MQKSSDLAQRRAKILLLQLISSQFIHVSVFQKHATLLILFIYFIECILIVLCFVLVFRSFFMCVAFAQFLLWMFSFILHLCKMKERQKFSILKFGLFPYLRFPPNVFKLLNFDKLSYSVVKYQRHWRTLCIPRKFPICPKPNFSLRRYYPSILIFQLMVSVIGIEMFSFLLV